MTVALEIATSIQNVVDIIEVGTSLIKDYGLDSIRAMRKAVPQVKILADIKTMDEGEYEFKAAYASGCDIATVMGAASIDTVKACYQVSREKQRDIMVDLLEVSDDRISKLRLLKDAIYCIHTPTDATRIDSTLEDLVSRFNQKYPQIQRIAVAGGVSLEQLPALRKLPIEICIVGGAITRVTDPATVAGAFYKRIHRHEEDMR